MVFDGKEIFTLWYMRPEAARFRVLRTTQLVFVGGVPYAVFEWFKVAPNLPKVYVILDKSQLTLKAGGDYTYNGNLTDPRDPHAQR